MNIGDLKKIIEPYDDDREVQILGQEIEIYIPEFGVCYEKYGDLRHFSIKEIEEDDPNESDTVFIKIDIDQDINAYLSFDHIGDWLEGAHKKCRNKDDL